MGTSVSLAGLGCAGEANHSDKASTVSVELSPCSPHPDKSMRGYMDESKGPLGTLCSPNSVNRRIVTSLLSEAPAIGQPSGEGVLDYLTLEFSMPLGDSGQKNKLCFLSVAISRCIGLVRDRAACPSWCPLLWECAIYSAKGALQWPLPCAPASCFSAEGTS